MLPSIGFMEMMVLALLAIIVVGPKDLPKLMRTLGQWTARIRAMGNEFKAAFDDMDADGEVAAIRKEIEELKKIGKLDLQELDPELDGEMRELDAELRMGTDMSSPHTPEKSDPEVKSDD
ncbi:Sec-independent protein translocase protein TatB [Litorimonas sp. WD9-15]|uniref:Sec-independent protein translocase protein TatB n=1 Tax=Litorimonas sp. WD9-15 TaxID=3418716 RepID=UPI003CFE3069